jgi:hypothetical protein
MEAAYSFKTLGSLQTIWHNSQDCTLEEAVVFHDVRANLPVVDSTKQII